MNHPYQATTYETHTRIITGLNCISQLVPELRNLKPNKIMVVSGPHVSQTDFYKKCIGYIEDTGYDYVSYNQVKSEVPSKIVEEIESLRSKEKCDLLIAIGGGSVIDATKAVGVVATNGGRIKDWMGYEKFDKPPIPLISIPTTAGTASEVTAMCIINDEETNLKFTVGHKELNCSKIAFLDPMALASCPRNFIAQSGVDAFSHNFESFLSLKANPITEAISLQGIRLISKNLRALYANSQNINAAMNMLIGSVMGGMSFSTTGCGNVHCMGRFIGPRIHINHGSSIALIMPAVARFNHFAQIEKFAKIAEAMDVNTRGMSLIDAGYAAIDAIECLIKDVGLTQKLGDFDFTDEDCEFLAQDIYKAYQNHYLYINPRKTTKDDYVNMLKDSYKW